MIITDEAVEAAALAEWKTAGMPVPLSETDDECQTRMKDQARAALRAAGPLLIAAELRAQADEEDDAADYAMNERPEPGDEDFFLGAAAVLRDSAERLRARAADVLDGGA